MDLLKSGDLAEMSGRGREQRAADHERQHEQQPKRGLESIDRTPQWIAVDSDPSGNSPDQRHLRNSPRAPAPRPSHQESIPSPRQFSPVAARHVRPRTWLGRGQAGILSEVDLNPQSGGLDQVGRSPRPSAPQRGSLREADGGSTVYGGSRAAGRRIDENLRHVGARRPG
jgi:hypothetical protein